MAGMTPRRYIEKNLLIRTKDSKVVPLKLNPAQVRLYEALERQRREGKPMRVIILKARQLGFSTLAEALIFQRTATRENVNSLVIAHREDSTANLFKMSKFFFEHLPEEERPLHRNSNARELVFESPERDPEKKAKNPGLMSRIRCNTAGGGGVGRSDTIHNVHASEFAFWSGDKTATWTGIMQAVPSAPDTMVIVESTANGFDEFHRLWDILERKQNFINQVMNGENVGREAEDTGEVTLSAAEVKALASGSPLIMEQVQLETDIKKLESLRRAHMASLSAARTKMEKDKASIASYETRIAAGKADMASRVDTYSEGRFSITVGKKTYTDKKDAGVALMAEATARATEGGYTAIGRFAGFELRVVKTHEGIKGLMVGRQGYNFNTYPNNTTYMINHLVAIVEGISTSVEVWEQNLSETRKDLAEQEKLAAASFAKQEELDRKRARYNEVMSILNPKEEQSLDSIDEGAEQNQSREYLDDEKPKEYNKRSKYSETETLFLMWANGSAPVGEIKRFVRFGKHHYYEKTESGCVEISRKQYDARGGHDGENTYTRIQRQINGTVDQNEHAAGNLSGGLDGDRNTGRTYGVSGQTFGEELRNDARRSVSSLGRRSVRATMTESRIDYLIADSGAGMRTDYAQSWITSINPTDFLNLTLGRENQNRAVFDTMPGDYGSTVNDYDFIEGGLKKETRQTPYLAIDINTGKVVGHEGRHRMRALEKEGATYAEIRVEFRDSDGRIIKEKNGYGNPLETIDSLKIFNQRGTGQSAIIRNIIPLNKANRDSIIQNYGPSNAGDIQFQQRTGALTDRMVLEYAADELSGAVDLTDGERDALRIFRERLEKLRQLQEKRQDLGTQYKEQQFGPAVDRKAAAETLNRMRVLDEQIKKASAAVLSVEDKAVLKRVLQKARKVVEQQERERGREVLNRWRERRNNAAAIKKYRERIRADVDELTGWVLHPNNKDVVKHIPDALKNTVIPFLSSIDFTSKQQLRGGAATRADKEFMKRLAALRNALKQNMDLNGMYSGYNDLPPDFMENLQSFIDSARAIVDGNSGEFVINQMTGEELRELSKVVRTLKKYITQLNRFHANAMYQHVYEAGDDSIRFLDGMKNASEKTGTVSNFILWQQIRPAYAFERFGDGGMAIYDGLRRGQATLAFNTQKIKDFAEKTYTAAEVKAWEKQIKTINLGGDLVKMPVSTIMSFYELSKRPQALGHILGNGVRVATYKNGREKISDVGHMLTPGDISTIVQALTPRQREVADALQKFMAEQGGEWGNYVSVRRFGEELFGEEHYFPIHSDGRHLQANADEHPSAASLYALLNMSFTKELKEEANNRIILYSIFDVFANHMASMAQYNALALPVLDALKWFNYQQKDADTGEVLGSVREQMSRVYGVPEETRPGSGRQGYAETFVMNILKAFNGTEAQGVPTDTTGITTLRHYNMAQVAYNFRVVVQQPLSITRAALLVDYSSIIKGMRLAPRTSRRCGSTAA